MTPGHQCESLRSVLEGVTSEESLWQSPAYMAEPLVEGSPRQEPFAGKLRISNTAPGITAKFFVNDRLQLNLQPPRQE